ncbi:GNAT family N-acetyltransferase [Janthinobacterium psychrotolerans]|uniref:Protein N-acetyltransferase, RimJ/RimL family n=1 Tax=Janthinobacterium psychrotolerans TaxID=1747903 RepID=A0A1A7C499_9BURK|nr:GNAT family N-acetyltransferase [Janthinobacterium psychrotolerans]OBV39869.1 Protein N-acetyltransferase, RimJ/RimL family [Janthinobacterium psychrotolerans]
MPELSVRPLNPDDAPAYRALRLAAIAELPAAFCTTHALESSVSMAQMRQRLQPTRFQIIFGIFDDTQLIAMAGLRRETIAVVHDKASLWGVYVAPQARGHGLGRQLVQAAVEHAGTIAELATVRLAVAHDNAAALTLYLSCGFVLDGAAPQAAMLQMQLALPRPAVSAATAPQNSVFLKIKT